MTGIVSDISIETQLIYLQKILPKAKRIGVLYDPKYSDKLIKALTDEAVRFSMTVVSQPVASVKDVPNALLAMQDKIDTFWIIPDQTIVEKNTRQQIIMFWMKYNIPIIGTAPNYVKAGALYCLSVNYQDLGRQTALMCIKILTGSSPAKVKMEYPRQPLVTYNERTATTLQITIPPDIKGNAQAINY